MSQFFLRTNKTEGKAPLYVMCYYWYYGRCEGMGESSEEFAGHAKI